jgi:CDP-6-deoxy-D-xylo-4-hexulose-3-dehydrase
LSQWLLTKPRLTKGELTIQFEKEWSAWLGAPYSVFTNSGSSANFLMFDSLIQSGRLKSKNIIVPAVSWVTTVAPVMQLGLTPILCEADKDNLGLSVAYFEKLIKEHNPAAVIIVHVLGVPNEMDEIVRLCRQHDIILLEDTCESPGSTYKGKKVGTFGLMSSFSFYFGHHMSTIEGGMISCADEELYAIMLSIRSHGWARDLPAKKREELEAKFNIGPFESLYTFYYPGYNFRPTDLNAFLGLLQLKKLDDIVAKRNANYLTYYKRLAPRHWTQSNPSSFVSNFSFALIDEQRGAIVKRLTAGGVETRPLICGSIGQQPFWKRVYGEKSFPVGDRVHKFGFYLPNNHQLTEAEVHQVCDLIDQPK